MLICISVLGWLFCFLPLPSHFRSLWVPQKSYSSLPENSYWGPELKKLLGQDVECKREMCLSLKQRFDAHEEENLKAWLDCIISLMSFLNILNNFDFSLCGILVCKHMLENLELRYALPSLLFILTCFRHGFFVLFVCFAIQVSWEQGIKENFLSYPLSPYLHVNSIYLVKCSSLTQWLIRSILIGAMI